MRMSRPLRIQYSNAWYHVMNRGRRGDHVFESKDDYVGDWGTFLTFKLRSCPLLS